MNMGKVSFEEKVVILEALLSSIRDFYADERDRKIIEIGINERSMVAQIFCRLRVRLRELLPGFDVDYEYNRHLRGAKMLRILLKNNHEKVSSVIPDLVIHQRDTDEHNAFVVEFKKVGVCSGVDNEKLKAFTGSGENYQYDIGLRIILVAECEQTTVDLWREGERMLRDVRIGNIADDFGKLRKSSTFATALIG